MQDETGKHATDEVIDDVRKKEREDAMARTTYHIADVKTIFARLGAQLEDQPPEVILNAVRLASRRADRRTGLHSHTYKPNGAREVARRKRQMEKRNAR